VDGPEQVLQAGGDQPVRVRHVSHATSSPSMQGPRL
jgi:hypothetical protein